MKQAIQYLRNLGFKVSPNGTIISKLPDGEKGITLVDMLEENTMQDDHCYTIVDNKITKLEL